MKSAKHIVILSPGFAENESDENCIPPIQLFIKTSRKLYPDITFSVIAFQYPFSGKAYQWNDTWVYPVGGKNKKYFYRLTTWLKAIRYFIKIKSKNKNITLHSLWLTECSFIGLILSKIFRLNFIATVMGQDAKAENKYLKYLLRKFNFTVLCCSEFAAKQLKRDHKMQCVAIIPFGTYEEEYVSPHNTQRSIDIIGVGNLGPIKRYDLFVKIIANLKDSWPSIYCEIVGDGEYRNDLQKQINDAGLTKNIFLAGNIKRKEVLNKMSTAKIFLHTSSYEGQGYVYLEALASGCYVVSFDKGFLPDHDKVKICKDENEITNTLLNLLHSNKDFSLVKSISMTETVALYQKYYFA